MDALVVAVDGAVVADVVVAGGGDAFVVVVAAADGAGAVVGSGWSCQPDDALE